MHVLMLILYMRIQCLVYMEIHTAEKSRSLASTNDAKTDEQRKSTQYMHLERIRNLITPHFGFTNKACSS